MSDEERDLAGDEPEETSGTEEIDIEIGPSKPAGGSRAWFVIILIIILAGLALYALWAKKQAEQRELEAQQAQARAQQYRMQEQQIGKQLNKGLESLDSGDTAAAIEQLQKASTELRTLATAASSNDDTDDAARIQLTLNETQTALTELQQKQDELAGLAREKLTSLQRKLGVSPQEAPQSTEQAVEEGQATGTEQETEKTEGGPPEPTPRLPGPPVAAPAPR